MIVARGMILGEAEPIDIIIAALGLALFFRQRIAFRVFGAIVCAIGSWFLIHDLLSRFDV